MVIDLLLQQEVRVLDGVGPQGGVPLITRGLVPAREGQGRVLRELHVCATVGLKRLIVIVVHVRLVGTESAVVKAAYRASPGQGALGAAIAPVPLLKRSSPEGSIDKSALRIGGLLGDDIDHAVHGVDSPGHTCGAADDLDPFDVLQEYRVQEEEGSAEIGVVQGPAKAN